MDMNQSKGFISRRAACVAHFTCRKSVQKWVETIPM